MAMLGFPRPPVPPVPFTYDPNQVDCEILKAVEVPPDNSIFWFPLKGYDADPNTALTLTANDPNVWIPTPTVDPNGLHHWRCDTRVGTTERVLYFKFILSDGDKIDERMVLINVKKKNTPPVLGWE